MQRLNDWSVRFNNTIIEWKHKKFIWGETDCCQFISAIERSIYGFNKYNILLVNSYDSKESGIELCNHYGYSNWIDFIYRNYNRINNNLAQVGDIGLVKFNNVYSASICVGSQYVAMGTDGLIFIEAKHIKRVWHI
jgi:hypothetical protein